MPKIKLTKAAIDAIPLRAAGQQIFFDTVMPGFGMVVGKTTKTYIAQRQVGARTVRVTIGRHGIFTPDQARARAQQLLSTMALGEDPTRRRGQRCSVTLQAAFDEYLEAKPKLRRVTVSTYRRVIDTYLRDWRTLILDEITPDMIAQRHRQLGIRHGEPTANNAMRVLRAVYNLAGVIHGLARPNPVHRLTVTRAWYRERRKQSVIRPHELSAWYDAVLLTDSDTRDFLLLLLFTGMRRSEGLRLKWREVDLVARTLSLQETKNGESLMLPLPNVLVDLLSARKRASAEGAMFVFPGHGVAGHLIEPKRMLHRVRSMSGVEFTLHDLRRTFITVAESLDISAYALKRLLNHKDRHDVTAGYIVLSVERLRRPMQMIADQITALMCPAGGRMKAGDKAHPLPEVVSGVYDGTR